VIDCIVKDNRLLVGIGTRDDAGVYIMDGDTALVQTIDVITPVVDDPADFGFIAAINALSDIYAMGGTPLTALSLLAFDPCDLPHEAAQEIMAGAVEALSSNNCSLIGGHTLEDPEIKFGLAVTGTVDTGSVVTNSGARAGDMIYLTKPLGTGIASTAVKGDVAPDGLIDKSTGWMKTSNRDGSTAMLQSGVTSATDVTGFGLLGHLFEMCRGSELGAVLDLNSVPLMEGIDELVRMGLVPEGAYNNMKYLKNSVDPGEISDDLLLPLFDPQTSGGLLVAIPPEKADLFEFTFSEADVFFARIGLFIEPPIVIKIVSSF